MTGRGATAPATTPKGRESTAARGETDESPAAVRRDGTDVRGGGAPAVRRRGNSHQLRQGSPQDAQDSARDHATVHGWRRSGP